MHLNGEMAGHAKHHFTIYQWKVFADMHEAVEAWPRWQAPHRETLAVKSGREMTVS
ncbi:hypothetical protein BD289DRAFT_424610 [Coniella lustricola]|uniref:Uncharacterized protein n=1 Tax=Coniella lustricola TaxID=2025994 RepID=A0A2T3AI61_9PEZI|nr:hypothetical protein BD289DRAFT_424610 [Coniella lustricola]